MKIPSVRGTAEPNAPFEEKRAKTLEFTEKLYSENGFETELNKNDEYCFHISEVEKIIWSFST